jgi:C-1 hydroxylase
MSICFNCGRLMPKDSKYCIECGIEANDKFSRVFKCVRENIGRTPIYLIMTYSGLSREQAVSYLEKLKTMRYVTGNIRDGYLITAAGAGIFKETEQGKITSLEKNKAVVRRLVEAFNKHDLSLLDELMTLDYFDHRHQLRGLRSYKQLLTMIFNAFPDYNETLEDIIAEGDMVWIRDTVTGTHKGEYRGLAPTGKKIKATLVAILRIADGKVVEGWEVSDILYTLKQLGVIEYTEKGKKLFPENAK